MAEQARKTMLHFVTLFMIDSQEAVCKHLRHLVLDMRSMTRKLDCARLRCWLGTDGADALPFGIAGIAALACIILALVPRSSAAKHDTKPILAGNLLASRKREASTSQFRVSIGTHASVE
jgi:hypothetical protein